MIRAIRRDSTIAVDDLEIYIDEDWNINRNVVNCLSGGVSCEIITLTLSFSDEGLNEKTMLERFMKHDIQNKKYKITKYYFDNSTKQDRKLVFTFTINFINNIEFDYINRYKIELFLSELSRFDTFVQKIHKNVDDNDYNIFGKKIKIMQGEVIWSNEK